MTNNPGEGVPFIRLRRITGYLSNLAHWNKAKTSEEKDRVKHGMEVKRDIR